MVKEMDQEDPRVTNFMKQHDISPTQAIEMMGDYYSLLCGLRNQGFLAVHTLV